MTKEEALAKISESENSDFEVFATEEHKTYLDNFVKTKIEEAKSEVTRNIHGDYDKTLNELFGTDRNPNEKTYNFLKRKFNDLTEASKSAEPLKAQIADLEQKLKDGSGDELLKKELDTVRAKYKEEQDKWSSHNLEWEQKIKNLQLSNEIDKAMVGLKFKSDIPDNVRDTFVEKVKADLIRTAELVDGNLIFKDESGQTLVNKDNALNPYTANELLKSNLESILDAGKKVDSTPKPKVRYIDGKEELVLVNPNAKSRQEVTQYLRENGIKNGTKEYSEAYAAFTEHLPAIQ